MGHLCNLPCFVTLFQQVNDQFFFVVFIWWHTPTIVIGLVYKQMIFDIRVTAFSWPLSLLPHFSLLHMLFFMSFWCRTTYIILICTQSNFFLKFFPKHCCYYGCSNKCGGPMATGSLTLQTLRQVPKTHGSFHSLFFDSSAFQDIVFFTDGNGNDELEHRSYFFFVAAVANTNRFSIFAILPYWLLIPYGPPMGFNDFL
jgi:hypothetical protein